MRSLALLLILANALFFAWAEMIDVRDNDLDRPRIKGTPAPRIMLVNEAVDSDDGDDASALPPLRDIQPPQVEPLGGREPSTATAATQRACTTVGPFADLANAAQAQAALQGEGFQPRQRVEEGEFWVGYWVSLQDFPSRAVAEETMRTLTDRGITDVYLLPGEPSVLSLGVFSDHQRAQRRANQIRAFGLEPRIDDRKRTASAYWIDVDLSSPDQQVDMAIFQTEPGKIMRLELRECPSSAGVGGAA